MVKRFLGIMMAVCLLCLPVNANATEAVQEAVPVAMEYDLTLGTLPAMNQEWLNQKIVLALGEQVWECGISDLSTVPVHVVTDGVGGFTMEITDTALITAWLDIVNSQLALTPAEGTETVYERALDAMSLAEAGSTLQLRYEFAELLKNGLQVQLASALEPHTIQINLNDGFLVDIPAGGTNIIAGTCTTTLKGSSSNRIHNITLGASKLNNLTIMPGEILSVSTALTPRTPANGYKLAGVYLDGETVPGYGGGICQISSTLYNAVMNSGLTVLERHPHSMRVSYLRAGLDAAISSGLKDLRIQNNYDQPVTILAGVEGKNLTISVLMNEQLLGGKTYKLWSEVPTALSARTYRSAYIDDVEVEREYIGSSTYSPHK